MRYRIIPIATIFSVLGSLAAGSIACYQASGEIRRPAAEGKFDERLVAANNRFGFELFNQLQLKDRGKNVFYSPLSVALALSMAYTGAAGETKEAMRRTLKTESLSLDELNQASAALINSLRSSDPKVELAIANSLWARREVKFRGDFLERNRQFFAAEVASLDFGAPSALTTINDWVSRNTKSKIPSIINQINPDDVMFLINAVYFKGQWENKFEKGATKNEPFYPLSGQQKEVPMMSQSGDYQYYRGDRFQAVRLFYGAKSASLDLFLPDNDSSIDDLLKGLSFEQCGEWTGSFHQAPGDIKIPRFKMDYESSLNDPLKAMGMGVAFVGGKADFSGMLDQSDLSISEVKHKAVVEVNEEGTEAAAATSVGIRLTSAPLRFTFVADHPFLMMIRDHRTDTILFMGVVVDPK
jgi:serine protease inhibitor